MRCVQRIGRRGLSSACIEGMLASTAPYLAVIDADLQHDETLLPRMLDALRAGQHRLRGRQPLPGRRRRARDWHASRARISRLATRLSRLVLHGDLTDPMSGFFMIRREAFAARVRVLSGIGFKILLDLLASSAPAAPLVELPYQFRSRGRGREQARRPGRLRLLSCCLLDKLVGRWSRCASSRSPLVGALGIVVHLATVWLLFGASASVFPPRRWPRRWWP